MAEYILQYGKYGVCTSKRQITIDMSEKPIEYYLDQFYPVGTYYTTMDETFDPNVSFVGTWVRDTDGLVTVAASDDSLVGTTGGEETHKVTLEEMPKHNHRSNLVLYGTYGDGVMTKYWNSVYNGGNYESIYNGVMTMNTVSSGNAHNNIQPSIIVNRWHRIE